MDLDKIIAELKREREKIHRAITALLEGAGLKAKGPTRKVAPKRRSGITPEGRRRLSLAMKRRWAKHGLRGCPLRLQRQRDVGDSRPQAERGCPKR